MERGWECWGVGEHIVFRGDVWRDECHGGVSIVGHGRCPCEGGACRGRWLFASRNHLPSCCTPLVRHKLLCVAVRDVISTQFPRRRAAAPIRRPCRPPQRTLSPREVGEATVLAPDHGLQSTRDCAEAARAPPSTRHPNQRQSGRSVAGAAPLPALRPRLHGTIRL